MAAMVRILLSVVLSLAGLLGLAVFAEETGGLRVNPFKRPVREMEVSPASGGVDERKAAPLPVEKPVLEATLLGSGRPLARINGRLVTVGESVDGYAVIAIRSGEATLRMNGQTVVLRLQPTSFSAKPPSVPSRGALE